MAEVATLRMSQLPLNGPVDQLDPIKLDAVSTKFASNGVILPPPEIKSVIDRSAGAIARSANPVVFEEKLRENQRNDPKFSFLSPADPYHAYYRERLDRIQAGEVDTEIGIAENAKTENALDAVSAPMQEFSEAPPPEFMSDRPNVSALDLEIIKLTALFTARRGRTFLNTLSAREGRNFQFEFLRPTHSLFPYFNRLVDQYTKVLHPSTEALALVSERATPKGKRDLLVNIQKYAITERMKRERQRKREDDKEAERKAFAEIDWHDYAIVQTIEFTPADAGAELPVPMTRAEVESMTLAQKRMAAMIMEDAEEDIAAHNARQAAAEVEAASGVMTSNGTTLRAGGMQEDDEYRAMRLKEEEERERELARARAVQASSMDASGPIKIKTDYVAKLGQKGNKALTTCTICGQQIPIDEIDEHMRIELLDPKWKSQRDAIEARRAQASELQRGANVVSSISEFARARVDIFGDEEAEAKRKRAEEEDRLKRREREKIVWDGHTATKVGTMDKYSTSVNFEEQIAAIHKAKGLAPMDEAAAGPGIGPSIVPPPMEFNQATAPRPMAPVGAGTISSAPQPVSAGAPMTMAPPMTIPNTPVPLPTLHYQGMNAPSTFGYQPPPPPPPGMPPMGMMHPSRMPSAPPGMYGVHPGGQLAGTVRSADEMNDGEETSEQLAKRQRVAKLPGGHLYPEQNWIDMHPHPIGLQIQLPNDNTKPEWKLDGRIVTVTDLPLTTLVSTLRERIVRAIGSSAPQSRIRLAYEGKELRNANTIASYNLEDGDLVTFSVKKK